MITAPAPRSPAETPRHRGPALRHRLSDELGRTVFEPARAHRHPWSSTTLPAVGVLGVVVLHTLQFHAPQVVESLATVRASLPLRLELLRLPASVLAPAPRLPMWGAVAQVAVVFWLGELNLGRRRTVGLIVVCHTVATLTGRWMLQHPQLSGFAPAVAHHLAHTRDTGPSAAVVGVCVYLSVVRRAPLLGGALWVAMILEVLLLPDLAGREHLVAMGVALFAAAPLLVSPPRWTPPSPSARRAALAA